MIGLSRNLWLVLKIGIGLTCVFAMPWLASGCGQSTPKRHVTVADTIEMTRWSDRGYFLGSPSPGPVALFSPDGRKFVVVLKRGRLDSNTNEYSLLLFHTKDAFRPPKPKVLLRMSSSSNRDAIGNVDWLRDNETLTFLGEDPGQFAQVYSLNVRTGRLKRLTHHETLVEAYGISGNGSVLVYEASPRLREDIDDVEIQKHGVVITAQTPADLFLEAGRPNRVFDRSRRSLFVERASRAPFRVAGPDSYSQLLPISVAPNGRYAIVETYLAEVPPSWSAYDDRLLRPYLIAPNQPGRHSNISHYLLLDTTSGIAKPLLDAPVSWFNDGMIWSHDGNSVVVSGTYLPLDVEDPAEREARKHHAFTVEIDLPSRKIAPISSENLKALRWDSTTERLLLGPRRDKTVLPRAYQKEGSIWKAVPLVSTDLSEHNPLVVSLREDSNTPPQIFVAEPNSPKETLLLDLNPQFSHLQFGKVEAIRWTGSDGHEVRGGLYFPPDFVPGRKYPLVIQTHGFREDRFWIDGPWSSAFAAQALAANDIMVLQVGNSSDLAQDLTYINTPEEAARQMGVYEGAIRYLENRGLIELDHVGLIGFSRTALYVAFTLTHSKCRFAAATMADGFDGGYVNFLRTGAPDYAAVNGGQPFGPALFSWLRLSPGFNLDKVQAAVRLEYYGWGAFLLGWQSFSGLTLLHKPVDFVWIPDGQHLLEKPWERMASQQGNVDWFLFWLKGVEDPDPKKQKQYERWRALRDLKDANDGVPSARMREPRSTE